jgi:hypothetical protein
MPGFEKLFRPSPRLFRRLITPPEAIDLQTHREELREQLGGRVKLKMRRARRAVVAAELAADLIDGEWHVQRCTNPFSAELLEH